MRDFREQNFYELLDVHPQANQQELDRAYQRARRIFNPDSVATYALFQPDELNLLRRRIEEAFRTLSDPERRAAYDQELARLDVGPGQSSSMAEEAAAAAVHEPAAAEEDPAPADQVDLLDEPVEADHAPADPAPQEDEPAPEPSEPPAEAPAEAEASGESEATAGAGDSPVDEAQAVDAAPAGEEPDGSRPAEPEDGAAEPAEEPAEKPAEEPAEEPAQEAPEACECGPGEMPVVDEETEITGEILLQARLAKGLSLDDYVQVTKISIYYLRNIETENFGDLPATVYVRGYLRQMAQLLGLDPKQVSTSYLERKDRIEAEPGE